MLTRLIKSIHGAGLMPALDFILIYRREEKDWVREFSNDFCRLWARQYS